MRKIKQILKAFLRPAYSKALNLKKLLKRKTNKPNWHNLRNFTPISSTFGFDRGTPIDRVYQEDFLRKHSAYIFGEVCEIAEQTYTRRFGSNVSKSHIFHYDASNPNATIIGDLTRYDSLPQGILDCFICTVTLNFIYDFKAAIRGIYAMLKPGGVALVTLAGLVQISKYDYERWGDFWRFSDMGAKRAFEEVFCSLDSENNPEIEVESYGNLIALTAELQGICAEELEPNELWHKDMIYPVIIGIKATKAA